LPHDTHPHPRLWGTFPRILGHYCRDLGLFSLETAVHKMTGLSARQFKLAGRGEIRVGSFADITLFDPETVLDAATFEQPIATARGIRCVIVNGAVSYRNGSTGPGRAGRFLHSSAASVAN
jgi:N-acyl-D-aspartate/D-glutamate deacylase